METQHTDKDGTVYKACPSKCGSFDYVKYDEYSAKLQAEFKAKFEDLERTLINLPSGRAKSLVLTKLEEAYMWVGKSIRDNQIALRGGEEQPERNNS